VFSAVNPGEKGKIMNWTLRILDELEDLTPMEDLQRQVWPGCETDVVPAHLLLAAVHHGGLLIAAYPDPEESGPVSTSDPLGFVFGFPGFYLTPDGPRLMHCSHMLGVLPSYRSLGLGFALKRAQWQMVRRQGIDLISWTYDPLLSTNAHLNIARLGAVSNIYMPNFYGAMRDELNAGLPSDRFQVDWWVNTRRVNRRLSKRARRPLQFEQLLAAQVPILNPAGMDEHNLAHPSSDITLPKGQTEALLMVEIPADFNRIKGLDPSLAAAWRSQTRELFQKLFEQGYLVTDFVHDRTEPGRSFYILSHGESTF
jgi:predicted GNAT superfamily acetyltransferase